MRWKRTMKGRFPDPAVTDAMRRANLQGWPLMAGDVGDVDESPRPPLLVGQVSARNRRRASSTRSCWVMTAGCACRYKWLSIAAR